jgi:hypothetical protein
MRSEPAPPDPGRDENPDQSAAREAPRGECHLGRGRQCPGYVSVGVRVARPERPRWQAGRRRLARHRHQRPAGGASVRFRRGPEAHGAAGARRAGRLSCQQGRRCRVPAPARRRRRQERAGRLPRRARRGRPVGAGPARVAGPPDALERDDTRKGFQHFWHTPGKAGARRARDDNRAGRSGLCPVAARRGRCDNQGVPRGVRRQHGAGRRPGLGAAGRRVRAGQDRAPGAAGRHAARRAGVHLVRRGGAVVGNGPPGPGRARPRRPAAPHRR